MLHQVPQKAESPTSGEGESCQADEKQTNVRFLDDVASCDTTERPKTEKLIIFNLEANCLQYFNPIADEIMQFRDASVKSLGSFTPVSMGSYIYVICALKLFYRLNFRDKNYEWERLTDMNNDHGIRPPSVLLSGSIYVIGNGWHQFVRTLESTNTIEKYDTASNEWVKLTDKPGHQVGHALVGLNDCIYVIGGSVTKKTSTKLFFKFIPLSSEWVELQPLRKSRVFCSAVAVGQRIFVTGGFKLLEESEEYRTVTDVESYDVYSQQWTMLSPMIKCPGYILSQHIEGCIYVLSCRDVLESYQKYDVTNDRWIELSIKDGGKYKMHNCVMITEQL